MEQLHYRHEGGKPVAAAGAQLVGVVASGNLEVLVEPAQLAGACEVDITTAATGFGRIWEAVIQDFFARHPLGDVRVSINDNGATPAIVSLRLDQAVKAYRAATGAKP